MNKDTKEKFINIYVNLPLGVRQEIILVLDENNPITWNVAFNEITNNTDLSIVILDRLEKLGII